MSAIEIVSSSSRVEREAMRDDDGDGWVDEDERDDDEPGDEPDDEPGDEPGDERADDRGSERDDDAGDDDAGDDNPRDDDDDGGSVGALSSSSGEPGLRGVLVMGRARPAAYSTVWRVWFAPCSHGINWAITRPARASCVGST